MNRRPPPALEDEVQEIIRAATALWPVERIVLFGSAARDDWDPEQSDLDVLVVAETAEGYFPRVWRLADRLQLKHGIDLVVLTPAELQRAVEENRFFLVEEVLRKGRVVYEGRLPGGRR